MPSRVATKHNAKGLGLDIVSYAQMSSATAAASASAPAVPPVVGPLALEGHENLVVESDTPVSVVLQEVMVRFALLPDTKAAIVYHMNERATTFDCSFKNGINEMVARALYDAGFAVSFACGGMASPIRSMTVCAPPAFVPASPPTPNVWTMDDLVGGEQEAMKLREIQRVEFGKMKMYGDWTERYLEHVWPHVRISDAKFDELVRTCKHTVFYDEYRDRFFWKTLQRHVLARFRLRSVHWPTLSDNIVRYSPRVEADAIEADAEAAAGAKKRRTA